MNTTAPRYILPYIHETHALKPGSFRMPLVPSCAPPHSEQHTQLHLRAYHTHHMAHTSRAYRQTGGETTSAISCKSQALRRPLRRSRLHNQNACSQSSINESLSNKTQARLARLVGQVPSADNNQVACILWVLRDFDLRPRHCFFQG